ncbi:MAG: helix-turn-helix domain-containing protein [Opitutales bacterium]
MQSIGQRLEEARKRQGISLREAAESTKIRSDFLGFFEGDQFDFDLPDVYKIGFLKLYARYLQLDAEKVATDFRAVRMEASAAASGRGHRREGGQTHFSVGGGGGSTSTRPGLGHINVDDPEDRPSETAKPAAGETRPSAPVPSSTGEDDASRFDDPANRPRLPVESLLGKFGGVGLYWKVGAVALAAIVLVVLLVLLVQAVIRSDGDEASAGEDQATEQISELEPFTFRVTAPAGNPLRVGFPASNEVQPLQPGETMDPVELDGIVQVIVYGNPNGALFEINGRAAEPIVVGPDYPGRGSLFFSSQGRHDRAGNLIEPLP